MKENRLGRKNLMMRLGGGSLASVAVARAMRRVNAPEECQGFVVGKTASLLQGRF